ncbi:MAG: cysteine methyltransferase, partial [Chloroflexota bacterium]
QRRVLEKTAEIPRGEVRPYAWVAREIGAPGAVRAVGTALGHNPIPFIIPCHRVVRADGSLGEYSGGGPAVKARVLAYEGVPLAELLAAA